eukprot:3934894-Rhodomonas_salina.1
MVVESGEMKTVFLGERRRQVGGMACVCCRHGDVGVGVLLETLSHQPSFCRTSEGGLQQRIRGFPVPCYGFRKRRRSPSIKIPGSLVGPSKERKSKRRDHVAKATTHTYPSQGTVCRREAVFLRNSYAVRNPIRLKSSLQYL